MTQSNEAPLTLAVSLNPHRGSRHTCANFDAFKEGSSEVRCMTVPSVEGSGSVTFDVQMPGGMHTTFCAAHLAEFLERHTS